MLRMAGILRWHEGSLAGPGYQGPADPGLEVVVVGTQEIKQVEHGEVGLRPVNPVVALEAGLGWAALHGAGRVEPLERGLLLGGRLAAEMGNAHQVPPSGEDGRHEGVSSLDQVADDRDRDRAISNQFARLPGGGDTSKPGVVVDANEKLDRCTPPESAPDGAG
jgi:hypothetical protein